MDGTRCFEATAWARPNVALVKYWGKRDDRLNLPATGSISLTLHGLTTRTHVAFMPGRSGDTLLLNGAVADPATRAKAGRVLDAVRARAGLPHGAEVESTNDFPTGAGLASSASGLAALAAAAAAATGLDLGGEALSIIARLGSGSAARSVFGGFVEMHAGCREDGADAVARPLLAATAWPLGVLVVLTASGAKAVPSTAGMEHTRATSPFWRGWLESAGADLAAMRGAILRRDLEAVGELSEHSALKLHGLALSARPGLIYWNAGTIGVLRAVRELRAAGTAAYFTVDAGPQVKVLCEAAAVSGLAGALAAVPGVVRVIESGPGAGVEARVGGA